MEMPPAELNPNDLVQFLAYHRPLLKAGDYTLTLRQTIYDIDTASVGRFSVQGERYGLAQADIHAVYPPPGADGPWESILPHVVLERSTLPWERSPSGDSEEDALSPSWLALLLFFEDEPFALTTTTVGALPTDANALTASPRWSPLPQEVATDLNQPVTLIDVSLGQLQAQLPSYDELALNAHARQIVFADPTRPAVELAVVVASRLPKPSQRCTAHLVSLERRYTAAVTTPQDGDLVLSSLATPAQSLLREAWDALNTHLASLSLPLPATPPTPDDPQWQTWRLQQRQRRGMAAELRISSAGPPVLLAATPQDEPAPAASSDLITELSQTNPDPANSAWLVLVRDLGILAIRQSNELAINDAGRPERRPVVIVDLLPPGNSGAPLPQPPPPTVVLSNAMLTLLKTPNLQRLRLDGDLPPLMFLTQPLARGAPLDGQALLEALVPNQDVRSGIIRTGQGSLSTWMFDGATSFRCELNWTRYNAPSYNAPSYNLTLTLRPGKRLAFAPQDATSTTLIRLISLYQWSFSCAPHTPTFKDRVTRLVSKPMQTAADPAVPPAADPVLLPALFKPATLGAPGEAAEIYTAAGYIPLPHAFRGGTRSISWYRGPLVPKLGDDAAANGWLPLPARAADELLLFDQQYGMFDASYATAWELGRIMALADLKFAYELVAWKQTQRRSIAHQLQRLDHLYLPLLHALPADLDLPDSLADWLLALTRLEGVPFSHLVPDPSLLPKESLRFFDVDPAWIESLRDGALSIGRVLSADHALDTAQAERLPVPPRISGLLLRSSIVADYPALGVRAYWAEKPGDAAGAGQSHLDAADGYYELPLLRKAAFAPDVLLYLFYDSTERGRSLNLVDFFIPPQVLHFGFEPGTTLLKPIRDPRTGDQLCWFTATTGAPLSNERVIAARLSANALEQLSTGDHAVSAEVLAQFQTRIGQFEAKDNREAARLELQGMFTAAGGREDDYPRVWPVIELGMEERVTIDMVWRNADDRVIDLATLFQHIALRLNPAIGDRVSPGDFALQMLAAPQLMRFWRKGTL